jgi:DNA segregation ATPase FtsK/SpoIIIE-like protein
MPLDPNANSLNEAASDPFYQAAVEIVLQNRLGSVALVQRHLRLGYGQAQKLLDRMQADGIVGEIQENGLREVLAPLDEAGALQNASTAKLDSAHRAVVALNFLALSKAIKK